jgi:2-C-methyl-D-erythritol 4-phosphate cytidylyltransferase/2-C-methyl-D-erythritol 2,4-cyclodiphosphate synthase
MQTVALIVAGGRGVRAGSDGIAKQYRKIGSKSVLTRTVEAFLIHRDIDGVQVVIGSQDESDYRDSMETSEKLMPPIVGGTDRQGSVRNGLEALVPNPPGKVLIHDGARPFATAALIDRVLDKLATSDGVIPITPIVSTLKRVGPNGVVEEAISRANLVAAQTPQGFSFKPILEAHRRFAEAADSFTDDAALAAAAGIDVYGVAGEAGNIKLTTADDIATANQELTMKEMLSLGDIRVGTGYDVHAFGPGIGLVLGGVAIEHDMGLIGHSDADVILHALTDAILGALGDGDIGSHFPPSEAEWRHADSSQFLEFAAGRVRARGGMIAHLDITLVGERPKLSPHRDRIRARIADICQIAMGRVGAKATTTEGLGFVGRREGLAAHATATIRLPVVGADA